MIIKSNSGSFEPAPEGVWDAVCVDVRDFGMVTTEFGEKHKFSLSWEISEKMQDGRPYIASKRYTASIHEKSTFFKDLKGWFGRGPTREFDTEKLIGLPCRLVIQHAEREDLTYANVTAVLKPGDQKLEPTGNFIRYRDRDENKRVVEPVDDTTPF